MRMTRTRAAQQSYEPPSWSKPHNLAMELAEKAADLARAGHRDAAMLAYRSAAILEKEALSLIDPSLPRTIFIIQNSFEALAHKAKHPEASQDAPTQAKDESSTDA